MKKLILAALLLAPASSLTFAQDARTRGERACHGDASRHCHKYLDQGDGPILQCLVKNAKRLSVACRKMLEDNGQL